MSLRVAFAMALLIPATPLAAQEYRLPLEWRWWISASLGFTSGTGATWNAIDAALQAGGWTTLAGTCTGFAGCQSPSGYAEDKKLPVTLSLRRAFNHRAQARLLGSRVQPGIYTANSGTHRASVSPAVTVLGAQALLTVGPAWLGAGPSVNFTSVTSGSPASTVTTRGTKPGVVIGVGFSFPPRHPLWLEFSAERRFTGSLDVPAVPVPGAQDIPAMRVPMSHTVISLGIGWRIP